MPTIYTVKKAREHGYAKTSATPGYSMRRGKSGAARRSRGPARLTASLVKEIRTWASREGAIYSQKDQIAQLQRSYPVAVATLRQILTNTTWHDPTYDPAEIDREYYSGGRSLFLLTLVRAVVNSATRS